MDRRHLLKNVLAGSAGMFVLPAWANHWNASSLSADLFSVTERKTLSALVEMLIPDDKEVPGAKSLGVDVFLEKLFKDCYEPEVQKNVSLQLDALEKKAQQDFSRSFASCPAGEREKIFMKMEKSEDKVASDFFKLIKSETIRAYTTSEYVMVNHLGYKVAPGHYYGCVPINS